MGRKRFNHINELRAKAIAGDQMAATALDAYLYVPPHLRAPDKLGAMHRRMGTTYHRVVHITAKTLKGGSAMASTAISQDYGVDRLQMLKARRERRAVAA